MVDAAKVLNSPTVYADPDDPGNPMRTVLLSFHTRWVIIPEDPTDDVQPIIGPVAP